MGALETPGTLADEPLARIDWVGSARREPIAPATRSAYGL
jgi:hypothetical protein